LKINNKPLKAVRQDCRSAKVKHQTEQMDGHHQYITRNSLHHPAKLFRNCLYLWHVVR